jgi:hypothetical protein
VARTLLQNAASRFENNFNEESKPDVTGTYRFNIARMSLGRRDNFNLSFPGDLQGTSRRGGANFKLRPPCCIRTGKPEPVLSFGGIKSGRTIFFVAGDKIHCGLP